ncbi:hypothetical protein SDRG_10518 [Saprolegnia diclina VS20]|uniref:Uncharacterized protein n=1 Tax=Saprolegnia diclina (strain VS20) TaxID=1156394 RepID=T0RNU7_SAPDV|nr:hypothetical protein SDRG_10518 [Saprolegnia diclina VS20]EQC31727.1 hypothetical protein SDRG_10518 [Saprolegnia diclina VS20]|eukprot:XP_008614734.1 hypothetical protein SDRG_10518 [Saprolegnia diclina VS20]
MSEDPCIVQAAQIRAMLFVLGIDKLMGEVRAVWVALKQSETTLLAAAGVTNYCVCVIESLAAELILALPYVATLDGIGILLWTDTLRLLLERTELGLSEALVMCFKVRPCKLVLLL